MSQPLPKPQAAAEAQAPAGLPAMAVMAHPDRLAAMRTVCPALTVLDAGMAPEFVLHESRAPVLIEQGVAGWDQLLLLLAVERPGAAVIVLSDQLPAHMVRALMKFRASDVLPLNAEAAEIASVAERLAAMLETPDVAGQPPQAAACWVFRGAVGGAGVSTIAIECAFALARIVGPGKVCLVDLNFADGMVASFLETVPKLDLESLAAAPERLDSRLLAAWCSRHEAGVSILCGPRNPEGDSLSTDAGVLRLLDVACSSFEYVLLDMPRHMLPWTKTVLAAADEVIVISELTVPSLHAAADMCRETDTLRADRRKARLILNRMFKKRNFRSGFPVDKAERAIERKIDATITSDWDSARMAVNVGKPIIDVKPKSDLVADVLGLVKSLLPEDVLTATAPVGKQRRKAG